MTPQRANLPEHEEFIKLAKSRTKPVTAFVRSLHSAIIIRNHMKILIK